MGDQAKILKNINIAAEHYGNQLIDTSDVDYHFQDDRHDEKLGEVVSMRIVNTESIGMTPEIQDSTFDVASYKHLAIGAALKWLSSKCQSDPFEGKMIRSSLPDVGLFDQKNYAIDVAMLRGTNLDIACATYVSR